MSNAATDLLPPPHCLTRSEGTHTVISARFATGVFTYFITLFAGVWMLGVTAMLAMAISKSLRNEPFVMTINGVQRESTSAEFLLFASFFVLIALTLLATAIFAHRGRLTASVHHDNIELFTGVLGIGRRVRVPRNVVRGVSIVSSGVHSSASGPVKVIRLDGSDVTTGLFLGPAGKAWFAQELRRALNLPT